MAAQLALMAGLAAASAAAQAAAERRRAKEQKEENRYMMERQHQLGLDMWAATGTQAQVGQLEAAGLNKALMYAGKGGGGQSAGMPSGTPAMAEDQSRSIGMALQTAMLAAQVKNIEADTKQKEATTTKTLGVDTQEGQTRIEEAMNRIENLKADVNNKAVSNALMNLELKIKEATGMENAQLANDQLKAGIEKVEADTEIALTEGKIKKESADAVITQTRKAVIEQQLRISLQRGGIIKQGAETQQIRAATGKIADEILKIQNDITVANESVKQRDIELKIKEGLAELQKTSTEFNTGWMAEIERGSRIIENTAGAIGKLLPINRAKKAGNFPTKKPEWMSQKQWEYINNND